jgi:hypothetical protein
MAFGHGGSLTLEGPNGEATAPLIDAPAPLVLGSGPQAFSQSSAVASSDVTHFWIGTLLHTGAVRVESSGADGREGAALSAALLDGVRLRLNELAPLLSFDADQLRAEAVIEGSCCDAAGLTAHGSTTISNGALACFLPGAVSLPERPEPNTELLDHLGMRIVLNEQIVSGEDSGDLRLVVNAAHIYFTDLLISGIGEIDGDLVLGHAEASLNCAALTCAGDEPASACVGDCSVNHAVTVDEVITGVNIALDLQPMERCAALDESGDQHGDISELIRAVFNLLNGCPRACLGR